MKRLLTTKYLVLALLILCVLLLCAANLFVGSVAIPMGEVCGILLGAQMKVVTPAENGKGSDGEQFPLFGES